ncbi:hypothetical protein [Pseudomonas sp. WS 5011]|uniref:hypothetical protein n=1 Tax=Pseudomonas sp. WS 5011 TaxID=2717477 RepID=UPI0014759356|nr:hypothetical protein [Pseudomonas sp. WS 5011]NMY52004.1 hypothetical protein [Pseudomonas sp. WS 5011]
MKVVRNFVALCLITSAALLAGCGGDPSSADVMEVFNAQVEKQAQMMQSIGGKDAAKMFDRMVPKVTDVDVKSCDEIRDDVFKCDIELTAILNDQESTKITTIVLGKKKDGSWAAM